MTSMITDLTHHDPKHLMLPYILLNRLYTFAKF